MRLSLIRQNRLLDGEGGRGLLSVGESWLKSTVNPSTLIDDFQNNRKSWILFCKYHGYLKIFSNNSKLQSSSSRLAACQNRHCIPKERKNS